MMLAWGFGIHSPWCSKGVADADDASFLAFTATGVGRGRLMLMMLALGRCIHSH